MTQLFHEYSFNLAENVRVKITEIAESEFFTPQCSFNIYALMAYRYKDLYDPSLNGMYEPVLLLPVLRRSWRRILNAAFPKGRCWSQSAA
jgi:hypothetical protein